MFELSFVICPLSFVISQESRVNDIGYSPNAQCPVPNALCPIP
ncbi:hypothetical protein FDUTEX481_03263 [Tolypothrix sp. PCC 7601]|nr:hypothetical protein FDUTEX481_03263 [Tolypothrix sp. PCC 7601]